MPAATYFKLLAALMNRNPPSAADSPIIGKMAKVGIVPGRDFDVGKLEPAVAKAFEQATTTGLEQIQEETTRVGKRVNGWQMTLTEKYGTDYLFRARRRWSDSERICHRMQSIRGPRPMAAGSG